MTANERNLIACFLGVLLFTLSMQTLGSPWERDRRPSGAIMEGSFDKQISGTVRDEDGVPLQGASITVKGTKRGTTTDEQGRFTLGLPDNASVLIISATGCVAREVAVGSKDGLNIVLVRKDGALNDVVVVGYGKQKKSDLTGAISSVKGGDLNKLPTQRVDQALQGRATGVSVQNTDGQPGGNVTIRVRGGNSIIGGNDALVVIDGLQGGNISTINPNDVEAVEVLKDASATAIYGARGANGVILITTKRGVLGKPRVSYNAGAGTQWVGHRLALMNAAEYARKSNDYAATVNGTDASPITPVLPFTDAQIQKLSTGGGTDWQKEIFKPGGIMNHQLSVTGGNENVRYFLSGGYMDQQGILINTKYKRYTLRSNVDAKINKWLNAGVNLNLMKAVGNVPPTGEGTYFGDILGQVVNGVARFDPITPVYNASGQYNFKALRGGPDSTKGYADPDVWNPVASARETKAAKNEFNTEVSTFLEFRLLDGLTFKIEGAARVYNYNNQLYYNSKTQPGSLAGGLGQLEYETDQYYQNSNILTYDKLFGGKHHLTVTGVAEQQNTSTKYAYIQAQGFFSDYTGINDLGSAQQINSRYNTSSKTSLNSYLGRINYGFSDKYLLTASFRADGSSVFGNNNKWGYFPSASVAWKAGEEDFIRSLQVFSDLKLRASWGKTGNQAIQPYQSLATVASGFNYPYEGAGSVDIGYALSNPANPNLKWETTAQTDLGLEFGFFQNRLTGVVDVYRKKTTNLLLNQLLPYYTGFTSVLTNVGAVENKGLEIGIGAKPVVNSDFRWSSDLTISFNSGKVLALVDSNALPIITNTGGGYNIYSSGYSVKYLKAGQPIDQMRGYVYEGTWKESERAAALAYGQLPGDPKWKDVDHDGKITRNGDGNQVIGNATPKFIYGWNNSFTYKNFDLAFLIQGTYGNDIFNAVRIKTENPANGTSKNLNARWTSSNQNTPVPAFIDSRTRTAELSGHPSGIFIGVDNRSSRWVEKGSYMRLKNITLTYNVPGPALKRLGISRLSVYATGANLVTITQYSGYDPEVSSFNRGARVRAGGLGIDLSNYPSAKSIILGLNLTF